MVAKSDKDQAGGGDAATLSRGRAAEAIETARERTLSAYEAARSRARDVTRDASDQLSVYPVGAVIGGFALGALLAAVLPRTEGEDNLLGRTGKKITGVAKEAAQRGLDAGKEQIEQLRGRTAQRVGEAVADVVAGKQ
jgi:ElaB/YqjD/DUF883 family membrane-anchored ribosome-binding protein